jgi:hypothetical protein
MINIVFLFDTSVIDVIVTPITIASAAAALRKRRIATRFDERVTASRGRHSARGLVAEHSPNRDEFVNFTCQRSTDFEAITASGAIFSEPDDRSDAISNTEAAAMQPPPPPRVSGDPESQSRLTDGAAGAGDCRPKRAPDIRRKSVSRRSVC